MKITNKQAVNTTLAADAITVYTPEIDAQIRAFSVHNPTLSPIEFEVFVGARRMVKKTVTPNATEIIVSMLNQQLVNYDTLIVKGEGANVLITVVEITE